MNLRRCPGWRPGDTRTPRTVIASATIGSNSFSGSGAGSCLGADDQTVSLARQSNSVVAGAGYQTITLAGTGNTVTIGADTSTVDTGNGNGIVHAAGGNVTITAAGEGNLHDSGTGMSFLNIDGSASNTFALNAAGPVLTTGFNQAAMKIVDLG